MSKKGRADTLSPPAEAPPEAGPAGPLQRGWVALVAAAWVLGIVAWYYRLQLERLLQVLSR